MLREVAQFCSFILVVYTLAGCGGGKDSTDSISIISINPTTVVAGKTTSFDINLSYSLTSKENGVIYVGFNSYTSTQFQLSNKNQIISKGSGTATFTNISTIPVAWSGSSGFMVYTNLSAYPHASTWYPLAHMTQPISVISEIKASHKTVNASNNLPDIRQKLACENGLCE